MDNKQLYSELRATQYVGRNGISKIEISKCQSDGHLYDITIIGIKNYTRRISEIELISMSSDMISYLMEEIYYSYLDGCSQKEVL